MLAALAAASGARAGTTNPCRLVTAADAKAVLGASVGKPKLQTLGLYQSCTYRTKVGGGKGLKDEEKLAKRVVSRL